MRLRPLTADDAPAVLDVQLRAFRDLDRRLCLPEEAPPADPGPALRRIRHLAATDPGGAWVGEADGRVAGAALALVREGIWGLSLLVVDPAAQGAGLGSALLARTLEYGAGARGGLLLSSPDARALRAYARAGFALRPVLDATGPVRDRPGAVAGVREGRWPQDRGTVDAAGRAVRGAGHGADLPNYLDAGGTLLVHEAGGFAVLSGGEVKVLAARAATAARELLQEALRRVPENTDAEVHYLDGAQQWAVGVVLDAGLDLRPGGAVAVRGDIGPLRPYVPSGAYL